MLYCLKLQPLLNPQLTEGSVLYSAGASRMRLVIQKIANCKFIHV